MGRRASLCSLPLRLLRLTLDVTWMPTWVRLLGSYCCEPKVMRSPAQGGWSMWMPERVLCHSMESLWIVVHSASEIHARSIRLRVAVVPSCAVMVSKVPSWLVVALSGRTLVVSWRLLEASPRGEAPRLLPLLEAPPKGEASADGLT